MFFWNSWRKNEPVLIVSGLPRSGTSLMMQMLTSAGISPLVDNHRSADENNPKGYYEYEPTKRLHKGDSAWVKEGRGKVVKIISHQLKYLPDDESYVIIFMRRDIQEIIQSQAVMLAREEKKVHNWDPGKLRKEYQQHLIYMRRWLENQAHMHPIFVDYSDLLSSSLQTSEGQIQTVVDFIAKYTSYTPDTKAMMGAIDPGLYRQKVVSRDREE